ncbi:MAG: glycine betaine ABC transporter substrate-binding protein [Ilumatobacteraceae bacterium]
MTQRRTPRSFARRTMAVTASIVAAGLLVGACGGDSDGTDFTIPPTPRIVVTSIAGDPESELLAAIYGRALDDAGFRVVRRDPIELDRDGYAAELEAGSIHLIPEWSADLLGWLYDRDSSIAVPTTILPSGTATTVAPVTIPTTTTLPAPTTTVAETTTTAAGTDTTAAGASTTTLATTTTVVTTTTAAGTTTTVVVTTTTVPASTTSTSTTTTTIAPNGRGSVEQLTALSSALPEGLGVNSGSLANDNDVIACSADAIDSQSDVEFTTLTHLASNAPDITLGAPAGWEDDDEFGLGAWQRVYGGEFDDVVEIESDGIAEAIESGTADCFVVNSLDSVILTEKLTVLTDDRTLVRANVAVALMNAEVATPDLLGALDVVATSLTSDRLMRMLYEITVNGADPVVVANAFVDTI